METGKRRSVTDGERGPRAPLGATLASFTALEVVLVQDVYDVDAFAPVLELTLGPASLECAGTLRGRTRHYVLEAAELLFASSASAVTIDVAHLSVADVDGANTFAHLQRTARSAGVELRWVGLEPGRLRGLRPLGSLPSGSHGESAQAQRRVRHGPHVPYGSREDHPSVLPPIA
jgi:anti-anti-sigma regulatory factor